MESIAWSQEKVLPLLRKVGRFILAELDRVQQKDVIEKDLNSLVSYVDRQAEEQLVEGLQAIFPEAGFLTEEEMVAQTEAEIQWIIDPLDGTTNFLFGVPSYSISIGLKVDGALEGGWVYDLPFGKCYHALKGKGAFKEDQRIRVRANTHFAESLFATGFPYYDFGHMPQYMALLTDLMQSSRGIRRLGSAAIDLAYTAEGRFDAFYEYGLNPWDVAGGAVLVKEAGGVVLNFSGGQEFMDSRQIIAGSTPICEQLVERTRKYFE
jgi:myo-inositol-1(or 4)-monophosphatase